MQRPYFFSLMTISVKHSFHCVSGQLVCFFRQREGGPRKRKEKSTGGPKRRERPMVEEPAGKFKSKAFLSSSESDSDEDKLKIAEDEGRWVAVYLLLCLTICEQ